ncbi:hypothetical protein B0H10DRAFT_1951182 [Mycena sp. CBHHK59/15]|nr:hypothetical protein B0H10DRAFT_1951182 [Mycena sp. CBHHK59/15]
MNYEPVRLELLNAQVVDPATLVQQMSAESSVACSIHLSAKPRCAEELTSITQSPPTIVYRCTWIWNLVSEKQFNMTPLEIFHFYMEASLPTYALPESGQFDVILDPMLANHMRIRMPSAAEARGLATAWKKDGNSAIQLVAHGDGVAGIAGIASSGYARGPSAAPAGYGSGNRGRIQSTSVHQGGTSVKLHYCL